jgi:hypothetical protein
MKLQEQEEQLGK